MVDSSIPLIPDENKIYFSLPDFFGNFDQIMFLKYLQQTKPEYFRENCIIDSVYGTIPGCIFNGGRTQIGTAPREQVHQIFRDFATAGISVRLTFTNKFISEGDLTDHYCNMVLDAAQSYGENGVNTSSDMLAAYIKKKYPNLYLINSTTRPIKTVEQINKLSENTLTVPPYTINNTDAIDALKYPENIELLCCEACIDNCPNRKTHYDSISKAQMFEPSEPFMCPHGCEHYYYYELVPKRKHHISIDDIETMYLPRGINKFKISGRNDNMYNVIERFVNYFAKKEYRDNVRNMLLIGPIGDGPQPQM